MSTKQSASHEKWTETRNSAHKIVHAASTDSQLAENLEETLGLAEAAQLLDLPKSEVLDLIEQGLLCATRNQSTKEWLIERACALAQLSTFSSTQNSPASSSPETDSFVGDSEDLAELPELTETTTVEEDALLPTESHGFSLSDRQAITQKNLEAILDSLDFATVRLEGAMYRIGYLESQVDSYKEQLKILPEFRNRAAQALLVEMENENLKKTVDTQEAELDEMNKLLDKMRNSKTFRFFRWAFGLSF